MENVRKENKYLPLIGGVIIQIFVGIIYIWSIFQEPVMEYFSWSHAEAALTFSIMLPVNVLGVMTGGVLNDKKGARFVLILGSILMSAGLVLSSVIPRGLPWLLYIFYAGMSGFGGGLIYNTTVSCAQKWWLHKKGLAGGIIVCAYGMSTVIFTPLVNMLLGENGVGFKNTFRILAVVFLVIILLAGPFIVNPSEEYMRQFAQPDKTVREQGQFTPVEVLKSPQYYMILVCLLSLTPAYLMLNPMIKSFGRLRGLSEEAAVASVMITGIASAAGRLTAAWLSDKIGGRRVLRILYVITIICILSIWHIEGWLFIVLIALITYAYGGCAGVTPVLSTEYFGTRYMSTNFGLVMVSVMISGALYPALGSRVSAGGVPSSATFIIPICLCVIGLLSAKLLGDHEKMNL